MSTVISPVSQTVLEERYIQPLHQRHPWHIYCNEWYIDSERFAPNHDKWVIATYDEVNRVIRHDQRLRTFFFELPTMKAIVEQLKNADLFTETTFQRLVEAFSAPSSIRDERWQQLANLFKVEINFYWFKTEEDMHGHDQQEPMLGLTLKPAV